MHDRWRATVWIVALALCVTIAAGALVARAAGLNAAGVIDELFGARRETEPAGPQSPALSLIDNPSPTCYRPVASEDICYITWSSLQVSTSSPNYVLSMTVSIDGRLRAIHSGFFQTSMMIPGEMYGPGLQVACGPRNAAGAGKTYSYVVRARDTAGQSTSNFGSVTCPGVWLAFLPLSRR